MNCMEKEEGALVCSEELREELRDARLLYRSSGRYSEVYSFDGGRCRGLIAEVRRLRDDAFRAVGVALDDSREGDCGDVDGTYRQIVVWDAHRGAIVGGYRYAVGREVGAEALSLSRYFNLTERFVEDYLPRTLELGRTFVSRDYQRDATRESLYAISDLWQGIARVVAECGARYLVGRVTLYPSLSVRARDMLLGFMRYAFPPQEELMTAREPLRAGIARRCCRRIFVGETVAENYKILLQRMHEMGHTVPPIISSYMRLSPSLQTFDSYINEDLGGVVETAIMLNVEEMYDSAKRVYLRG